MNQKIKVPLVVKLFTKLKSEPEPSSSLVFQMRVGRSQVEHSKFTWNMLHSTAILPAFLDKETSLISKPHHYVDVHQKIGVRLWGTEVPKHWTNMGKKLCQMAKECPTKVVWDGRSMKNFKFIKFNSVVSPPAGEMLLWLHLISQQHQHDKQNSGQQQAGTPFFTIFCMFTVDTHKVEIHYRQKS